MPYRRPSALLALVLASVVAGLTFVAIPAHAAVVNVSVSEGRITGVHAEYGNAIPAGVNTSTVHVILPDEAADLELSSLRWSLGIASGEVDPSLTEFDLQLPDGALIASTIETALSLSSEGASPVDSVNFLVSILVSSTGPETVIADLARANAKPVTPAFDFYVPDPLDTGFHVDRSYDWGTSPDSVRLAWGDSVVLEAPSDFWATGPEGWIDTEVGATIHSADLGEGSGTEVNLLSAVTVSGDGHSVTVQLPASAPPNVNWSTGSRLSLQLIKYVTPSNGRQVRAFNTLYLPVNFFPTDRLAGPDRFSTAATVAEEFDSATTVYVANGRNFPDALSAAPAAAHLDAPLLLTEPGALPFATEYEILRLKPDRINIVGGTAVISVAVEAALENLYAGAQVHRLAGADRYATSREVTESAFGEDGAENAFVATGGNFPDALAASAAAAHLGAPVILVAGSATAVDSATIGLIDSLGVIDSYVVGGLGVVSQGIENSLTPYSVERLAGANRYDTAIAINAEIFDEPPYNTAYLAVGTGYADALAGAALAGSQDAPLFTVQGTCVPQGVLDALDTLGATTVVLLGGIGVLSTNVGNLGSCG